MTLKDYKYEKKDALSFLKKQPDKSIKLVVTSPPYNVGKEYETTTSLERYLLNIRPIIHELARTVTDDGSICWEVGNYVDNNGEVFPLDIYYYRIFKEEGFHLRNRIIWHFGHGLQCEKRFSGRYETILWFSKSDNYTFNLDDVRIPSKYPSKRAYKGENKGKLSGNPKGKNPEDLWLATVERLYDDWEKMIWDIPNVNNNHPEKTSHPCQFPIELVERCVLALSNEDDIVYDPFAGVGSSIIAALKNRRRGYGTELVDEYIKIGQQRIEQLQADCLPTRPIYKKLYEPNGKLAEYPVEWMEQRLEDLQRDRQSMNNEIRALTKDIAKRKQQ